MRTWIALGPAEYPLGSLDSGNRHKAAQAAVLQLGRLLDQPPLFLGVIREHFRPQRFLAGAPGRNVILFGHLPLW